MSNRFAINLVALASLATIGTVALAQTYTPPVLLNIAPTDIVPDTPAGGQSAQSTFTTPAQIAGVPGYSNGGAVVTGFSYTFGHAVTDYFVQPAGTLATGTLTTEAFPSDGQRECFLSTQTQTALTWAVPAGQAINNAPTAGVANTPICITYVKTAATWFRAP